MKRLLLAVVLFPLVAFAQSEQKQVIDGVVAVVGKTIVKTSDIEQAYAQIRRSKGIGNGQQERCNLLESILINKLLIHKGMVDSTTIDDEQVEEQVEYYLKQAVRQAGSKEKLRDIFGSGYDELHDQYFDILHDRMLSQKVENELTGNIQVTPAEVSAYFATYSTDSLPMIASQYEISEIVIEPTINEAERDRVRGELAELRERILKGESFSMLAKLYSQDPGSASKGGELGLFGRGDMVAEFEAAAFALKPGDVSPIVETKFGFHILQLIERRGNNINVRHILLQPKTSSEDLLRARVTLDSLAQEIRLGHTTFAEAAKRYSTSVNRTQGGIVTNPSTGNPRFDKQTFDQLYAGISLAAMQPGELTNASSFTTEDNKRAYRLVMLSHLIPEHKANLTDDYDLIHNAALQDAKSKKIIEWCNRMVKTTYIRIAPEYRECPNFQIEWPK